MSLPTTYNKDKEPLSPVIDNWVTGSLPCKVGPYPTKSKAQSQRNRLYRLIDLNYVKLRESGVTLAKPMVSIKKEKKGFFLVITNKDGVDGVLVCQE